MVLSYSVDRQPVSVNVVPGHKVGKKAIRPLIASVGKDWRKERHHSEQSRGLKKIRI
jgi:hypothetical protein